MIEHTLSNVTKGSSKFAPVINRKRNIKLKNETLKKEPPKQEERIIIEQEKPTKEPEIIQQTKQVKGSVISTPVTVKNRPITNAPVYEEEEQDLNISKEALKLKDIFLDIPSASMAELIRHPFAQGKLSQKEEQRLANQKLNKGKKPSIKPEKPKEIVKKSANPQMILVNGKMVVDKQSLQIQQDEIIDEDADVVEEDASLRYVSSASFRNKKKVAVNKWTDTMTERFFDGLSYFGTDFKTISYMFPGMTHKHIKLKYKFEESKNPHLITRALLNRKKAPASLRAEMLQGIKRKQDLEDSMYVNKKQRETIEDIIEQEDKEQVKREIIQNEISEREEQPEEEVCATAEHLENHAKTVHKVEFPELSTNAVKAPVNTRRKKRKVFE